MAWSSKVQLSLIPEGHGPRMIHPFLLLHNYTFRAHKARNVAQISVGRAVPAK
jgi:hypothetical protein